MSNDIEERLEDIKDRGLYRRLRSVSGPQGPRVLLDGRPVLLLCSNNYLGLADQQHARPLRARHAAQPAVQAAVLDVLQALLYVTHR